MKKIIRRIFLALLAVVVLAGAVFFYLFTKKPDDLPVAESTFVDSKGNTYARLDDYNGKKVVAVTDENGNIFRAKVNSDGSIGETIDQITTSPGFSLPTNYTGEHINETVSGVFDGSTNVVDSTEPTTAAPTTTQPPATSQAQEPGKQEQTTTTEPKPVQDPFELRPYRIEKYQKLFQGGTYLIEFTTNDEELGDTPITAALKNGNFIIDTRIQSMSCKMLYLKSKDTTYLILDNFKKYCKLPEDLMGEDMDMGSSMLDGWVDKSVTVDDISVKLVEINGQKLICESYTSKKGMEVNYYFDGETLVRRDNTNENGGVDSTYITRLTSEVPDSMFDIPKNYGYLNLSLLGLLDK